jgi:sulfur relay (sulfurtransferase) DsrF/TusC family protein
MIGIKISTDNESIIRESIDLALSISSFDMKVSLFLEGDAVFLADEKPFVKTNIVEKDLAKYVKLISLYDVFAVYIKQDDLDLRSVVSLNNKCNWIVLKTSEFNSTYSNCKHKFYL